MSPFYSMGDKRSNNGTVLTYEARVLASDMATKCVEEKYFSNEEKEISAVARKSIVSKRDIPSKTLLGSCK